ncbi:NAD(P)-dependent alcohol dehydrogenase [Jannaschia sp. R86511]|uniref:NAD(P)-dependent alcohol dehydrogenase n=1 Tax=Jannaschia sp. R86511 TaxID=3093853 RepID=UPI0036D2B74D
MTHGPTSPERMRVSVLLGAGHVEVRERDVPAVPPGEVLVQVASVGVCGSDVHYWRHMRIGDYVVQPPLVLGHEVSGRVVAVGEGVPAARLGERVSVEPQRPCHTCPACLAGRYNLCADMRFFATPPVDGAFAEYVLVPDVFAHRLPEALSDDAGALLEPLSVGIAALRRAGTVPGDRVLVAGAGPIGVIVAQVARAFGAAEVIVSDPVPERRERALRLGATATVDPVSDDLVGLDLGVDAFVDASGVAAAVRAGIRSLRPAGTAVVVGLGDADVSLPVATIQDRELVVTGVFRYTGTWPLAAHLVASGQVDLDCLVTGRHGLADVGAALDADLDPGTLKVVVEPAA